MGFNPSTNDIHVRYPLTISQNNIHSSNPRRVKTPAWVGKKINYINQGNSYRRKKLDIGILSILKAPLKSKISVANSIEINEKSSKNDIYISKILNHDYNTPLKPKLFFIIK